MTKREPTTGFFEGCGYCKDRGYIEIDCHGTKQACAKRYCAAGKEFRDKKQDRELRR